MAKVIGSIDDLGRPVIRIEVPDRGGFLAVVDTGFNRSLLLLMTEAQAMGFAITEGCRDRRAGYGGEEQSVASPWHGAVARSHHSGGSARFG